MTIKLDFAKFPQVPHAMFLCLAGLCETLRVCIDRCIPSSSRLNTLKTTLETCVAFDHSQILAQILHGFRLLNSASPLTIPCINLGHPLNPSMATLHLFQSFSALSLILLHRIVHSQCLCFLHFSINEYLNSPMVCNHAFSQTTIQL